MQELDKLLARAQDAVLKRNYDYARDLLSQIINLNPDHAEARKALFAMLIKKFKEVGFPSSLKMSLFSAKILSQIQIFKSKPDKVIEMTQRHLCDDPNNVKVRMALGEALRAAGHVAGAVAELETATEVDPASLKAWKQLGIAYKEQGQVRQAEAALQKVLDGDPQDRDAAKILRDLAAITMMQKGMDTAVSYRDMLKDKDQAESLEQKHHIIKSDDAVQKELDGLMAQVKAAPQDVKIYKKIADFYFDRKKDFDAAKQWYLKASQLSPTDIALKNRADDCISRVFAAQIELLEKANDPRAKEVKLNKLRFDIQSQERRVAEQPTDMGLHFDLGRLYYQDKKVDKGIGEFQQSVKDPRRKIDSHMYLGMSFWAKKMHDLAITQFQKAMEGGLMVGDKALYLQYNMALCYEEAGETEKAIEVGKKIMGVDINYKDISAKVSSWMNKAGHA